VNDVGEVDTRTAAFLTFGGSQTGRSRRFPPV